MKSVVIQQPNELVIEERQLPVPGAGDVRVSIKLAGICGSDSHIYRGHNPFAKYPRVIGHEFFGVIDAVGEGVDSAPGPARFGRSGDQLRALLPVLRGKTERLHLAGGAGRSP